jgi:hypothetical protein
VRVRVQDQQEDAKVEADSDGELALCFRPGAITPKIYMALVLVLAPLEQGRQYLQSAS